MATPGTQVNWRLAEAWRKKHSLQEPPSANTLPNSQLSPGEHVQKVRAGALPLQEMRVGLTCCNGEAIARAPNHSCVCWPTDRGRSVSLLAARINPALSREQTTTRTPTDELGSRDVLHGSPRGDGKRMGFGSRGPLSADSGRVWSRPGSADVTKISSREIDWIPDEKSYMTLYYT